MNVLVVGGTRFVGRHMVQALIERGHAVTLFNRGSNRQVFTEVAQVHGDRKTDLARLDGRSWDAVLDTSGYTPDVVEAAAGYFAERTRRYVFVSTISVYDASRTQGPAEDSALLELPAGVDETVLDLQHYGPLKVLCERRVRAAFGDGAAILRPGLVAGPFDPTDRFTYWPVRFDEGGDVLAPPRSSALQYIDARDLAAFCAHVVETGAGGTFNCVTPPGTLTLGDLFDACLAQASAEDAAAVEVPDAFLDERGVAPWSDLPLWVPRDHEHAPIVHADSSRALMSGLTIRPLQETVRDTLAWARSAEKRPGAMEAGLSPERETQLLMEYRALPR